MEKTKLGISVGLLGAIACFTACFSGYLALFLIVGYVLIREDSEWLKKICVKAVLLLVTFSVVIGIIDLIPDFLNWISSFLSLVHINFYFSVVNTIVNVIISALSIIRTIFFLLMGLKALKQGDFAISFLDSMIEKYM